MREESEKDYVGCPHCFKRIDVAVGRVLSCTSPRCDGQQVTTELLPRRTFLAGDSQRCYLLDFIPFCHRLSNPDELVGKEVFVKGIKKKEVHRKRYGTLPVFCVLDSVVSGEILTGSRLQLELLFTQSITNLFLNLFDHQPSDKLRKGLALELMGVVARQEISRDYDGFSFEWNGVNSYLGKESKSSADFEDSYGSVTVTDQYKNTNGQYQPSKFESTFNADHYTVGAVANETSAFEWFRQHRRSVTILGEQVTEFPLTSEGSIQPQYLGLLSVLKESILRRLGAPTRVVSGGQVNRTEPATQYVSEEVR